MRTDRLMKALLGLSGITKLSSIQMKEYLEKV